jgi:RNA polymerase sigma-70 factor (ECF subfamily)
MRALDSAVMEDRDRATEVVLRELGPEIYGWLLTRLASEGDAADAFSLFSVDLWKSLARHQGRCSLRTWCYMLARHAVSRVTDARAARQGIPLSQGPISQIAAEVRETTQLHLRSEVKARVRSLRDQLDPDDQLLLVLRVDKDLGWRDIALVMLGDDAGEVALARSAATLRKRFERVKERLRALAAGGAATG